ncbi:nudC domain-containing protein 3 [Erpetoichthys calabaricus]|uniref:NudC domain-containing protein 3 n=1 Tax=Erpetoichthys calabaricus TaxID=27687 RepID=A0A8C4RDG1_ERPCA|nr:nudC domain-containing protein 3 [Erpetoichthys calabaricus]
MSDHLEMTDLYDQALLGILQHVGDIQSFLHVYFGFLYRKTDFFRLLVGPQDKMGFPPGVAEKMILKTFKTFERIGLQDHERRMKEMEEKIKKAAQEEEARRTLPPATQEVVVESVSEEVPAVQSEEECSAQSESQEQPSPADVTTGDKESVSEESPKVPVNAAAGNDNLEEGDLEKVQAMFQANPDSYNGAVRENYIWSQDYTDLEIKVPVPVTITKGRQVSVNLQSNSIRVAVLEGGSERILMEGKLAHKINTENSLWSLEPGKCILVNLNKNGEYWWQAVLEGEQAIDINKINRERSMATVDEEEHAVLDRLTFDYHRKLQGKPQSHEMKVHEMLKRGWDAEGSPFRGQQFDPTMFDISPGAVQF